MLTPFGAAPSGSPIAYAPLICCSIVAVLLGHFSKTTSWYGRNQVAIWSILAPLFTLVAAWFNEKIGEDVGYATVLLMIFAGLGSDRLLGWFPIPAVRLIIALGLQAATESFIITAHGHCAVKVVKCPIEKTNLLHEALKNQAPTPLLPVPDPRPQAVQPLLPYPQYPYPYGMPQYPVPQPGWPYMMPVAAPQPPPLAAVQSITASPS